MQRRIWIDVEDLLEYALTFPRPSGIQRLAWELYAALMREHADRVGFVRQDRRRGGFTTIGWDAVARVLRRPRPAGGGARGAAVPAAPAARWRGGLRRRLQGVPAEVRVPLVAALRHQAASAGAAAAALRAALAALGRPRRAALPQGGEPLEQVARAGDVLAAFGSPWFGSGHAALLRTARQRLGLQVALLLYDVIPLARPEWCDAGLVALFRDWFRSAVPEAEYLFAISHATAGEVRRAAEREGVALAAPIVTVPIGSGFGLAEDGAPPPGLPAAGSYVLFVSTLEVRKNHLVLVRAWRRLLEELPDVPQLVFAGRVGSMVADLMQELNNSGFLGGRVRLIEAADDAALAALYRGALFTVFPSLCEGWGLPVTESLAFGKPCVASNASSVPEAGGELVRYFDPESVTDAGARDRPAAARPGGAGRLGGRDRRPLPAGALERDSAGDRRGAGVGAHVI